MDIKENNDIGSLNISETVIEKIAQLVVDEIDGVYSMAPSPGKFSDFLFNSEKCKPIRLNINSGVAQIDVYVILKTGYKIKEVAETIQEYIKDAVQNMASITVSKINIFVRGVSNEKD